jgi:predicted NBD/HSP70 family sugar kinase
MATKKKYTIGIDIGGTNMKAILFDGEKILSDYSLGTPKDNLEHLLVMLQALIEPLLTKAQELKIKVEGVGLGVAGWLNQEGEILMSPNLPLLNKTKIGELLAERIKIPVVIENDANCFVLAEALQGAGKKYESVYGITVGTGIGGGWCLEGKIFKTKWSGSGEPGHVVVNYAEGLRLEEAYQKLTQNNPAQLAEEAYRGDVLAGKAFEEFGFLLGTSLANLVNLIAPEVIILGGGVIEASDLFFNSARKSMKEFIISEEAKKNIKLVKSKLGNNAGAIGAALLPFHR